MDREQLTISDNINESDSLFRYISLAQFISMIENKQLFLKKVKLWDDPWEAPDEQLPIIKDNDEEIKTESLLVSSTVGQCWTYEKDSDAMWRIYSNDRQGIMIETVVNNFKLIKNLKYGVLSKVIYYNKANYIQKRMEVANNPRRYAYAGDMVLKREAFKHENEARLLVCLQGYREIDNIWDIPVVGFEIEPECFIKSITFDPRADEWFVETMKKYCNSKGLTCNVEKSTLYKKDFYESTNFVRKFVTVE